MSYIINATKPYIFIHIPKTAGASIIDTLSKFEYSVIKNDRTADSNYHSTIYDLDKNINIKNFIKFSVVRNPYDRVISWYNFRIKCLRHDLKQHQKNNFRKGLVLSENYADLKQEYDISKNFDNWLLTYYNQKWDNTWFSLEHNQYDWIGNHMNYIIRFENLESDLKKYIEPFNDLELSKVNITLNRKSYRDFYSSKSKTLVTKIYEKDLDIFKYTF
jgi:chondroitin 4-sulfotransferase 11